MKHMSMIMAANAGTTLAMESETLALEGFVDAVKNPVAALKKAFPLNDKEAFSREIDIKRKLIAKERKGLAHAKTAVSQGKDTADKKVSLSKVAKQSNFSAATPDQVLTGMVNNRKTMEKAVANMEKAKTKQEAKAVLDALDAHVGGRGQVKEEMMVSRAQALKIIDEGLRYCDAVDKFLVAAGDAEKKHFSTEGIALEGFVGAVLGFIFEVFVRVIIRLLAIATVCLIYVALMTNPWLLVYPLGGLLLIGLVSKVNEHNNEREVDPLY